MISGVLCCAAVICHRDVTTDSKALWPAGRSHASDSPIPGESTDT
jgi:hypothetical protein